MGVGKVLPDSALTLQAKVYNKESGVEPPLYICIGTGTNTPVNSDTALQTEVLRKLATRSRSGAQNTYEITVAPGELTANVTEFGLINTASGAGDLGYREVVAPQVHDGTHGGIYRVILSWGRAS